MLTPINGEPSYKAHKRLKNELCANASSVDSDLGGGDHGYLGLVLDDKEYTRIVPDHPFVAPDFPGALRILPGTDTVNALNLRENYSQSISLYKEYREVERALMRHITTSIEPKYIDSLKNEDTDLVEDDLSTVLDFLCTHYGKARKKRSRSYTIYTKRSYDDYLSAHRTAQDSSRNNSNFPTLNLK